MTNPRINSITFSIFLLYYLDLDYISILTHTDIMRRSTPVITGRVKSNKTRSYKSYIRRLTLTGLVGLDASGAALTPHETALALFHPGVPRESRGHDGAPALQHTVTS
jgi:hypothetical protein